MTPKKDNQTSLDAYISSFCNNYVDVFPLRSSFVKSLKDLTGSDFDNECTRQIT
jgi:hypothetical protein